MMTVLPVTTVLNSPYCQLKPLWAKNADSILAWFVSLNVMLWMFRTKNLHMASSGYEHIAAIQVMLWPNILLCSNPTSIIR